MVGSIDPRCETIRGPIGRRKVAWLFGARVAETILASGPLRPHQQAGHMDASDPIRPSKKLLWHGGRPHMGPCFRRDDGEIAVALRQWRGPRVTESLAGQTVEMARRALTARFKSGRIDSAELDARILVGATLDLDLTGVIAAANRPLTSEESIRLEDFARRRFSGEA